MNARRTPTNTRKGANQDTIKTSSLAGFSTRKLARLVCFSKPASGYIDCTNYKHAMADERAARIGWFDAIMAAILINAAFVAVFAAKIAAFIGAVAAQ